MSQLNNFGVRNFHVTYAMAKCVAGRYRATKNQDLPLTYEMANHPQFIGVRKAWNTWNTSSLLDAPRTSEITIEDTLIRKFMQGTWHRLFLSEIIIKRRANIIIIAGIVYQAIGARKLYFLIGYSEEILSYFLKCPVKLELQTADDKKALIFKYI